MDRAALVELHLHLDISISFDVATRLEPGLTRTDYELDFRGPARCGDLAEFLQTTSRQVALLQSADALRLHTEDLVRRIAAEGVVYAELRFAPLLHTAAGMAPEAAVETVVETAARASAGAGIDTTLILCSLRHFSEAESLRTADLAVRFADHAVAFDLAGDEGGFSLSDHLPAFRRVIDAGVPYTVHAGEGAGPESVTEVLDLLAPKRLGHGVRAVEDPALVERIIRDQVHLETCPSCNVQLGLYPSMAQHPVDQLYRAGASISVSTDSRTSTVTTMPEEFAALGESFGWTPADRDRVSLMAIDAAFASPEVKQRVRRRITGEITG
ncbi:adenosine deaminase [Nocardioides alcanivorans]|uniref:adenosine deaminase n=1 Tax=Nocardioides alcanivorans TaxID=2897352 RepID=UPI001F1C884B|nr:adenosine deaminase [Nocardioides alcanivorans]